MPLPPCPVAGCGLSVDIALRSSDRVLIGAHKANLELYGEAFPPADAFRGQDGPEIVELSEHGDTLKLLLHFMHKNRYPDTSSLDARAFYALAEAAGKYEVYSAMAVCVERMLSISHLKVWALASLAFALKFRYPTLADAAAPYTIAENLETMESLFDGSASGLFAWAKIKERWLDIWDKVVLTGRGLGSYPYELTWRGCKKNWPNYYKRTLADLPSHGNAEYLRWIIQNGFSLDEFFANHQDAMVGKCFDPADENDEACQCFHFRLEWASEVNIAITQIPTFSSLCRGF